MNYKKKTTTTVFTHRDIFANTIGGIRGFRISRFYVFENGKTKWKTMYIYLDSKQFYFYNFNVGATLYE